MVVARLVAMLLMTYGVYFASATPAHARTRIRPAPEAPAFVYSVASTAPGADRSALLPAASEDGGSSGIPLWIILALLIGLAVSVAEQLVSRMKRKR